MHSTHRNRLEDESECSRSANLKTQNELPVNLPFLCKFVDESLEVLFCNGESKTRRITFHELTRESVGAPVEAWT